MIIGVADMDAGNRYHADTVQRSDRLESVRRIREALGSDRPLVVRVTGVERHDGGHGLEFTCQLARWLEEAGSMRSANAFPAMSVSPAYSMERKSSARLILRWAVRRKCSFGLPKGHGGCW